MPDMTGQDMRDAIGMADDDMLAVQGDLKRLARESRLQVLKGDERKQFFEGLDQDEFDILHSLAMSMGPRGLTALERLMQEATDVWKERQDG